MSHLIGGDQFTQIAKLVNNLGVAAYRDAKKALGLAPMSAIQNYTRLKAALLLDELRSIAPETKERVVMPLADVQELSKDAAPIAKTVIELGQATVGMHIRLLGQRKIYHVIAKTARAIKLEADDGQKIKADLLLNYWAAQVEVIERS